MSKYILRFVLSFLTIHHISAQTVEPSSAVSKNLLHIEIESLYDIQIENDIKIKSWSIPRAIFRYGLLNGFEIQLNTPIVKEQMWENDHIIHTLNKFDNIQFGFTIDLLKEKGIFPEVSLLTRFILPTEKNIQLKNTGQLIALNFSNSLSEKFSFNYNIGFIHETDHSNLGYYIANLSYELNSKIHFFIENYANFTNEQLHSQNISTGFGYNFNENVTLDYSIGSGIDHLHFYSGLLLTWEINTKKVKI